MLEKPDLPDQQVITRVEDEYGVSVAELAFLPLGYDVNTAVYRLITEEETSFFLKLRKGPIDETVLAVPHFLAGQGIRSIIAPLETRQRLLWGSLESYKMILYPYVEGQNGYEVTLASQHWIDLGATLRKIHTAEVPPDIRARLPQETFLPEWRETVRWFQLQVESTPFADPVSSKFAAFMREQQAEISHLVRRAEQLAHILQGQELDFVLCHSDLHPGNLLIRTGSPLEQTAQLPELYIVDWDNPILAPKERDLMFFGAGMGSGGPGGREEKLFYLGYRPSYRHDGEPAEVDRNALAYYRYERIIQDIAEFCKQVLLTSRGGEDRQQSYQYFTSQFLAGREVAAARITDPLSANL